MSFDDNFDDDDDYDPQEEFTVDEEVFLEAILEPAENAQENKQYLKKLRKFSKTIDDPHRKLKFYASVKDSPLGEIKAIESFLTNEFYKLGLYFKDNFIPDKSAHSFMHCANLASERSKKFKQCLEALTALAHSKNLENGTLFDSIELIIAASKNKSQLTSLSEIWIEAYETLYDADERKDRRDIILGDDTIAYPPAIIKTISEDVKNHLTEKRCDENNPQTIRHLLGFTKPGSRLEAEWYTRYPTSYFCSFSKSNPNIGYNSLMDEIPDNDNPKSYSGMLLQIFENLETKNAIYNDMKDPDKDITKSRIKSLHLHINEFDDKDTTSRIELLKYHSTQSSEKQARKDIIGQSFHALVIHHALKQWEWTSQPEDLSAPTLFKEVVQNRIDTISPLLQKDSDPDTFDAVAFFIQNKLHIYQSMLKYVSFDTPALDIALETDYALKHDLKKQAISLNNNRNFLGWEN